MRWPRPWPARRRCTSGCTTSPSKAGRCPDPQLAETLALLARWLSGSQKHTLADSFAAFIGHPAYNTGTLCADLHRFAFLLGASDGEELFGEPAS